MTTIEMIYGKEALKELLEPHSDPSVRKLEETLARYQAHVYVYRAELMRDELPAHYRKVKINS